MIQDFLKNDTLQFPLETNQNKELEGLNMSFSIQAKHLLRPTTRLVDGQTESDFADVLRQSLEIVEEHPAILEKIKADQDAHGQRKKAMRLEDKRWEQSEQPSLEGIEETESDPEPNELSLQEGRPRTKPIVVYVLMMIRGYKQGVSTREYQDFVQESRTLTVLLENLGESLPARSTISENLNCITNETRAFIHQKQMETIQADGLDDCQQMTTDTTAVKADTEFPMDPSVLKKLIQRVDRRGNQFEEMDNSLENYQTHWMEFWRDKLKTLEFELHNTTDNRTYKATYRELYEVAQKAREHLMGEAEQFEKRWEPGRFKPSRRQQIQRAHEQNKEDLEAIGRVIEYSRKRVCEGESTPANEKVLSLGDDQASFIKKGDREPVIGYRPRVSRSKQGFVTELNVPVGNPSDSTQLEDAVRAHQNNTGVFPKSVTVDDGFANQDQRETVLQMPGVQTVCIAGSRGKSMTPDEQWESDWYQQLRKDRSAVESLIFTVKYGFSFGQLARRGADAVRAELLEDVLAYNVHRMVQLQNKEDNVPKAA